MNYRKIIAEFIANPNWRLTAIQADRAYNVWQRNPDDLKLQKKFLAKLYQLPIEY